MDKKNIEILGVILSIVVIILMLITLGYTYYSDKKDENRQNNFAVNFSNQISEVNSNIIKVIPKNPDIGIQIYSLNTSNDDFTLTKKYLYTCTQHSFLEFLEDTNVKSYNEIRIFLSNSGRQTQGLNVRVDCGNNEKLLHRCVRNDDNIDIVGDYFTDQYFKIKEIGISSDYFAISLIYLPETNLINCHVKYDSPDTEDEAYINVTNTN